MKAFLTKKDIIISFRRYGVEAMGTMTLGLFASLIMGLILSGIGRQRWASPGPTLAGQTMWQGHSWRR